MQRKPWKKYGEAKKLIEVNKVYELVDAISLLKKVSYTKFDWTVELHVKTNADPKYNDQMIRATVVLPNWIGKTVRIWAYLSEDKFEEAKKAWADVVWNDQLIKDIEHGKIDFDVLITTNDMMRNLAKVAKTLWPKGLMPSPKAGTVTADIVATINEIKKGRIEFKLDKTGNIHCPVGKVSFSDDKLVENIQDLLKAIEDNKPAGVKWKLVKKVVVAPTMGPWVPLIY